MKPSFFPAKLGEGRRLAGGGGEIKEKLVGARKEFASILGAALGAPLGSSAQPEAKAPSLGKGAIQERSARQTKKDGENAKPNGQDAPKGQAPAMKSGPLVSRVTPIATPQIEAKIAKAEPPLVEHLPVGKPARPVLAETRGLSGEQFVSEPSVKIEPPQGAPASPRASMGDEPTLVERAWANAIAEARKQRARGDAPSPGQGRPPAPPDKRELAESPEPGAASSPQSDRLPVRQVEGRRPALRPIVHGAPLESRILPNPSPTVVVQAPQRSDHDAGVRTGRESEAVRRQPPERKEEQIREHAFAAPAPAVTVALATIAIAQTMSARTPAGDKAPPTPVQSAGGRSGPPSDRGSRLEPKVVETRGERIPERPSLVTTTPPGPKAPAFIAPPAPPAVPLSSPRAPAPLPQTPKAPVQAPFVTKPPQGEGNAGPQPKSEPIIERPATPPVQRSEGPAAKPGSAPIIERPATPPVQRSEAPTAKPGSAPIIERPATPPVQRSEAPTAEPAASPAPLPTAPRAPNGKPAPQASFAAPPPVANPRPTSAAKPLVAPDVLRVVDPARKEIQAEPKSERPTPPASQAAPTLRFGRDGEPAPLPGRSATDKPAAQPQPTWPTGIFESPAPNPRGRSANTSRSDRRPPQADGRREVRPIQAAPMERPGATLPMSPQATPRPPATVPAPRPLDLRPAAKDDASSDPRPAGLPAVARPQTNAVPRPTSARRGSDEREDERPAHAPSFERPLPIAVGATPMAPINVEPASQPAKGRTASKDAKEMPALRPEGFMVPEPASGPAQVDKPGTDSRRAMATGDTKTDEVGRASARAPWADLMPTPSSNEVSSLPTVPAAAAPLVAHVAEDPALQVAVLPHVAHVSIASDDGELGLHVRVKDGNAEVRIDGTMAPIFEARSSELKAVLAGEGLELGKFDLGQESAHQRAPSNPAEDGHGNRGNSRPQYRGPDAAPETSRTDDGHLHVTA